jgi:phosphoenolpyruvate carboxykinase (ATP)
LSNKETVVVRPFNLSIPTSIEGLDSAILNPENCWENKTAYRENANKLAEPFIKNFVNFTEKEEGKALIPFGPTL